LLESELAIARFSGWARPESIKVPTGEPQAPSAAPESNKSLSGGKLARVQTLTEGAIHAALLERIDGAVQGDSINIALFYLADRSIVESLLAASRRGINVRIILDPNKDSYGHTVSGLPNRPAASELISESDGKIRVRW